MRTILFVVLLITCLFAYQDGWYSLTSETGDSTISAYILHSGTDYVEVSFQIPGFFIESQTEGNTTYWRINLKNDYERADSTGLPEIPILSRHIAIPECDSYKVSVYYYSDEVLQNFRVYPVPEVIYDSVGYHEEFTIDSSFYFGQYADTLYPIDDYESSSGYIRNQKLLHFTLNPFRYDAEDNEMTAYSELLFHVDFYGSSDSVCKDAGPMNNICRSLLLNSTHLPRLAAPIVMDTVTGSDTTLNSIDLADFPDCDYLIIVADTLWNNQWVDSIAEHRAWFNGFDKGGHHV